MPSAIPKLSIVTSIYKTAVELPEFYSRAVAIARQMGFNYELIIVNDASPDDGLAVAKALAAADRNVIVVDLARNYGQHKALRIGLQHSTGDLIAFLDSDLEDDPQWLAIFHEKMIATNSDVAYGVRSQSHRSQRYRLGRAVFHVLLDIATGEKFPRSATAARLMTRRYVDAILSFHESEIYLLGLCQMAGFGQTPVPVEVQNRSPTSYTPRKLVSLFVRGVTSFSVIPLYLVFIGGVGLSIFAGLFVLYLLVQKFLIGVGVEGWTSVMAAVLLLGGVSLLFNGIVAIYVGTIFLEVKKRPTVIREIVRNDGRMADPIQKGLVERSHG
jgi:putative glycosyltransferase